MASRLRNAAGALSVIGLLAAGYIGAKEGMRLTAYRDIVGVPTVCSGETRGVKLGDKYTVEQCRSMLSDALVEFETGVRKCLVAPDAVPAKAYVAFLSLAYNIGQRAFCDSTVARKANARDFKGACDAILAWNKAGGRVIRGLVLRRAEERAMCLDGIAK